MGCAFLTIIMLNRIKSKTTIKLTQKNRLNFLFKIDEARLRMKIATLRGVKVIAPIKKISVQLINIHQF